MTKSPRHRVAWTLIAALGLIPSACQDSDPVAVGVTPADDVLSALITEAIIDEYRAEAIYRGVVAAHGAVSPFQNIIGAEERHSTSLARLFSNRGWAVPEDPWTLETVPHFTSVPGACAAGVEAEIENAALYDALFADDLPLDVVTVFRNNQAASLERHLPAFERCM